MVKRICSKCNAEFYRKSNYDKHINKKFDCRQITSETNELEKEKMDDLNMCDFVQDLCSFVQDEKILQNNIIIGQTNSPNISKSNFPDLLETNNYSMGISENKLCCSYCNKNYSSKSTLARHLLNNCKIKKDNENEKENIFKMLLERDKRIDELEKQNKILIEKIDKLIDLKDFSKPSKTITNNLSNSNNNLSNSNNTTNTQNNLIINFGKEDLGIIDRQMFLDRVIKNNRLSGVKIPDEILRIIHFNPNYPQLSNIYISDINREKCMIFEDGEWKLSPVDKIPEVIEKVVSFSNDVEIELKEKYPNNKRLNDRFDIINKYNNMNNDEYVEELKENAEDNKDLIKRCENFQKMTYNTFKTTLYNEGKNIKKIIKNK
jgi:hypothetical protein